MKTHKHYLSYCIELAANRLGFCAPNPAVGCVIVKNNKIIAEGFHEGCGHPHAEVDALNKLNENLQDAILYVSLEPCCHYGRTPPCTERIKQSGIKKVFFGLKDPNPIVAGKGQAALIESGIDCKQIKLSKINKFYRGYVKWTQSKIPWVTAKIALSADYKIAFSDKKTAKISGKACDELTHRNRQYADAILTSIETIIHDNPQLNARIHNITTPKKIYVLDSRCRLPLRATLFQTAQSITVFHANNVSESKISNLQKKNVRCISIEKKHDGLNLKTCLEKIGEDGIQHLWIEAGAHCFHSFEKENLLDEIILYISNKKLGDEAFAFNMDIESLIRAAKTAEKIILDDDQVYILSEKNN